LRLRRLYPGLQAGAERACHPGFPTRARARAPVCGLVCVRMCVCVCVTQFLLHHSSYFFWYAIRLSSSSSWGHAPRAHVCSAPPGLVSARVFVVSTQDSGFRAQGAGLTCTRFASASCSARMAASRLGSFSSSHFSACARTYPRRCERDAPCGVLTPRIFSDTYRKWAGAQARIPPRKRTCAHARTCQQHVRARA